MNFLTFIMHLINHLVYLPTPLKLSYFWNFGSLLVLYLFSQILSGLFLSMGYSTNSADSFKSVDLLDREVNGGHVMRLLHIFGSSVFFLFIYIHISRGMYYGSYQLTTVWLSGVSMLILTMAVSFLGYVLPWGQMSYWGATVMTKFLSVMPYLGASLVAWMWGGFSVDSATLNRFFSLHFLMPFIMLVLVGMHLVFLHDTGSSKVLSLGGSGDKVPFFPYYLYKDIYGFVLSFYLFVYFMANYELFMESQNFMESKSLVTPEHMQPEWYFLSAYAVLRAIPSKLGGVIFLFFFIFMLYLLPLIMMNLVFNCQILPLLWWFWVFKFLFLIWLGSKPVEAPYMGLSQLGTFNYFFFFFLSSSSYFFSCFSGVFALLE